MKIEELQKAFQYLEENGHLEYGHVIPKRVIEKVLGMEYNDHISFIGEFLELKLFLEENGYLIHTRLKECEFIIYDTDEISHRTVKIVKTLNNKFKRLQKCLMNIKSEEFGQKDLMKFIHSSNIVNSSLNALKSTLKDI